MWKSNTNNNYFVPIVFLYFIIVKLYILNLLKAILIKISALLWNIFKFKYIKILTLIIFILTFKNSYQSKHKNQN